MVIISYDKPSRSLSIRPGNPDDMYAYFGDKVDYYKNDNRIESVSIELTYCEPFSYYFHYLLHGLPSLKRIYFTSIYHDDYTKHLIEQWNKRVIVMTLDIKRMISLLAEPPVPKDILRHIYTFIK